mgnify:FL=1
MENIIVKEGGSIKGLLFSEVFYGIDLYLIVFLKQKGKIKSEGGY